MPLKAQNQLISGEYLCQNSTKKKENNYRIVKIGKRESRRGGKNTLKRVLKKIVTSKCSRFLNL